MTTINPIIDRMLGLTADIAENLLSLKDSGSEMLPDELKLKIISLAELAATPSLSVTDEEHEETSALLDYDNDDNEEETESEEENEHQHEQNHSAGQDAKTKSKPKSDTDSDTESSATDEHAAEQYMETVIPVEETSEETNDLEAIGDATEDEFIQIADAEPIEESPEPVPVQLSESPVLEKPDYFTDHIEEPIVDNNTAQDENDCQIADDEITEEQSADEEIPPDAVVSAPMQQSVASSVQQPDAEYGVTDAVTLRKSFSINDAFLFRREIFGGSEESFNNALVYISHLSTKRQLQEFLVEELSLNLNEYPGKDFYTILLKFFCN